MERPRHGYRVRGHPRRALSLADGCSLLSSCATWDGKSVTTNPSLVAKSGRDFKEILREICAVVEGPVSAEVTALDTDGMLAEGRHLAGIAPNIAVKVPMTWDGLRACRALSQAGTKVNVTLCFNANQALLAAKAGAGKFQIFSLDTARLHPETYQFIETVRQKYKIPIDTYFPYPEAVQKLVHEKGLFSFYKDGHKECCGVRKVEPLRRALNPLAAWITGQRKDQSPGTRVAVPVVQLRKGARM